MNIFQFGTRHCSANVATSPSEQPARSEPGAALRAPWHTLPMSSNALRLLDEALQLPAQDRAELALRLLDSVGDEPASEVERAWIEEAKRRLEEIESGEVSTVPWAEARARIFAR